MARCLTTCSFQTVAYPCQYLSCCQRFPLSGNSPPFHHTLPKSRHLRHQFPSHLFFFWCHISMKAPSRTIFSVFSIPLSFGLTPKLSLCFDYFRILGCLPNVWRLAISIHKNIEKKPSFQTLRGNQFFHLLCNINPVFLPPTNRPVMVSITNPRLACLYEYLGLDVS
ncbi:MAG: hypothetical protein CM15mV29_0910 [uncultured marine virus]|nr:MAG: hypothetical protein CM15mV29_0910 [uncultured marine virus]